MRDFVKINEIDLQYAEQFFQNEKHFNEWLINVFAYYRGKEIKIKTKIVAKYFENYKKTMNYILESSKKGKEGGLKSADIQRNKVYTLEGSVEGMVEATIQPNSKVIRKKINNKEKKIFFSESNIFDKHKFKEAFPEWSKEKLAYYYETVLTWSNEGNKKIDWTATVRNWALRDEKQGKIKFQVNNISQNKYTEAQIKEARNFWSMDRILPDYFDKNDLHLLQ